MQLPLLKLCNLHAWLGVIQKNVLEMFLETIPLAIQVLE